MTVAVQSRLAAAEAAIDADISRAAAWQRLDRLPESVESTPEPFPVAALGPVLGAAVQAIAADVQAPDSLVGGAVLAAASLAAQPLANILLPHGQRCPLSLNIITAALSGDRKSAVDAVACHQIEEARKDDARAYALEMQRYEEARANRGKNEPEPTIPTPRSLTTGNATIEGLTRLLKHQSSVGVFSSEGGEMLGGHSLREDRRMSGLAFFLKAWGGESIDSMRSGDGMTTLLGRRLAMHILVQPVLLSTLLADPLAQGQGYLARCLISQPQTLAGTRAYRAVDPNANPDTQAFHSRIAELLSRTPTLWEGGDGYELKPRDLVLSEDAAALWIAFFNEVERQQAPGGELADARPFASKAAEHAARIAAVMTLVENHDARTVPVNTMDGAIQATTFYIGEHLRLTGAGREHRNLKELRGLWDWLRGKDVLGNSELLQKSPRSIRRLKADGIQRLMAELAARGYVRRMGDSWEVRRVQD